MRSSYFCQSVPSAYVFMFPQACHHRGCFHRLLPTCTIPSQPYAYPPQTTLLPCHVLTGPWPSCSRFGGFTAPILVTKCVPEFGAQNLSPHCITAASTHCYPRVPSLPNHRHILPKPHCFPATNSLAMAMMLPIWSRFRPLFSVPNVFPSWCRKPCLRTVGRQLLGPSSVN